MYQVIGADGFEYGPIDAAQIHQWIGEGRVTEQTLAKEANSNQWKALREIPEFAALLSTRLKPPLASPSRPFAVPGLPAQVPNYMIPAILTTLFCCTPLGIPAIYYSIRVNSKLNAGDVEGARAASANARLWCWICVVAGVVSMVLSVWLYKNYVAERLRF
jgi:interferon-induced transmembrane protein/uncharacterized protein DUF4339